MDIQKSTASVNSLISINNDRIKGYELALNETIDPDLKKLFQSFAQHSETAKLELLEILNETATSFSDGGTPLGTLYRIWMDIKAGITFGDRKTIIDSCLIGERVGLERYNEVLSESLDDFTVDQYKTIYRQYIAMKEDMSVLLSLMQLLPQS